MVNEGFQFPGSLGNAENLILSLAIIIDQIYTYMCEHLLHQAPVFSFPRSIKANQTSASLQTVSGHLEFIHGMQILNMALDTRSVGRSREPEVEVFMSSGFKVKSVRARVEVR